MMKLTAAFHNLVNLVSHIKGRTETVRSQSRMLTKIPGAQQLALYGLHGRMGYTNSGRLIVWATVASDIFSIITAVSFLTRKKCVSIHTYRAESAR